MRPSGRWAAVAVAVMTAPAVLAFPVLGPWYVVKIRPSMSLFDRGPSCFAPVVFCTGLPYGFPRRSQKAKERRDGGLSPV